MLHERQGIMDNKPFGFQSCIHFQVPLFPVDLMVIGTMHNRHAASFYIVDKNVEGTEFFLHLCNKAPHLIGITKICLNGEMVFTQRGKLLFHVCGFFWPVIMVRQDQFCSATSQGTGYCPAYPLTGPQHQGYFILDFHVVISPSHYCSK